MKEKTAIVTTFFHNIVDILFIAVFFYMYSLSGSCVLENARSSSEFSFYFLNNSGGSIPYGNYTLEIPENPNDNSAYFKTIDKKRTYSYWVSQILFYLVLPFYVFYNIIQNRKVYKEYFLFYFGGKKNAKILNEKQKRGFDG